MLGVGGGGGARDYNDPLKFYRFTERFGGVNNADTNAGDKDWSRAGATPQNWSQTAGAAGAMGTAGLVAHSGTGNESRWSQYNLNIGTLAAGTVLTIRVRPQAADKSANAAFTFGIQTGTGTMARVAGAVDFLGFRYDTAVDTNWHLVVKDNAGGAPAESTVTLGAVDTTNWTTLQLRYHASGVDGYFNGALMGTAPLTYLDTAKVWGSAMCAHNVVASGGSQRICDMTLYDLIVPTGGW